MTQVEKKGIGAVKIGLIVSVALVVLLLISTLLVYSSLQSQINTLNADRMNLQSEKNSLQTQVNTLQNEVNSLKTAQLQQVNVKWTDNHPLFSSAYVVVSGTIFNSGTNSANSVVITVQIYDSSNDLIGSGTISLGIVAGKSYENFEQGFNYGGDAYNVLTSISFT